MKKIFRRKRTWIIIILVVLLIPVVFFYVMMGQMDMNEKQVADYFKDIKMKPEFKTYQVNGREVFYATIGADTLPMVLFIHGAPGSWTNYIKYFSDSTLLSKAHLVAVDRPGYGNSGVGKAVTSIDEQAQMIAPLLKLNKSGQGAVLLGHSFGGPIVLQISADYPSDVKGAVLLAPAIDPDNEKMFWVNKPADWKIVKALMPKPMLTAQVEKMSHADELRKVDTSWSRVSAHTVYMYGDKDRLVPPVNVEFAKKRLTNAKLEVIEFPNEDHFIPWTQQDTITKVILSDFFHSAFEFLLTTCCKLMIKCEAINIGSIHKCGDAA